MGNLTTHSHPLLDDSAIVLRDLRSIKYFCRRMRRRSYLWIGVLPGFLPASRQRGWKGLQLTSNRRIGNQPSHVMCNNILLTHI